MIFIAVLVFINLVFSNVCLGRICYHPCMKYLNTCFKILETKIRSTNIVWKHGVGKVLLDYYYYIKPFLRILTCLFVEKSKHPRVVNIFSFDILTKLARYT